MKKALLAMTLLAGSAFAGPRVSIGFGVGVPMPVAPVTVVAPPCPGPGYVWVAGYYGQGSVWVPGFWRAPAVNVVVGPRYAYRHDFYGGHDVRREYRR